MIRPLAYLTAVLAVAVCGLLPLFSMVLQAFTSDGSLSLAALEGVLDSPRQWRLLGNSLALAASSASMAAVAGVPLGLLLARTDLPGRRLLSMIFALPLLVPPYVMAVAWLDLLAPDGPVAPLVPAGLLDRLLFGGGGPVLVLGTIYLPIPMVLTMAYSRGVDPRLEEAARLVCSWPRTAAAVTVPLIMPALLFSWLLVFILALGEFSVPALFRLDVFSAESFTLFSAMYDFKAATVQSLPLAAFALLFILLEGLVMSPARGRFVSAPLSGRAGLLTMELGRYRLPALAAVMAGALILVLMPVGGLALKAVGSGLLVQALFSSWPSLVRSLTYGAAGASLLTAAGFFIGCMVRQRDLPGWRLADLMCLFLFALPGTVLGIGLISLWNHPSTSLIYGSFIMVLMGYLASYTALAERIILAQLVQIPDSMDEAARAAGAGWARRLAFITVPLSSRGIAAAWLVGFLFCMRDTDITMLVYPPGQETMPVRIFTLMANGAPDFIAALCMLMLAAVVVPASILWMLMGTAARGKWQQMS